MYSIARAQKTASKMSTANNCPECNVIMTIVGGHKCEKCGCPTCAICCSLKRKLENRYVCATCFKEKITDNDSSTLTSPPKVQRKTDISVSNINNNIKARSITQSDMQISTVDGSEKKARMRFIGVSMDDMMVGDYQKKGCDGAGERITVRAVLSFKTQSGIITVKDTSAKTMKRIAAAFLISG